MNNSKDLTQQAPRSPRERVGDYVILGRALDKGRADIAGRLGGYHFDCPLDNMLFGFKDVKGPDIHKLLERGASDQEVVTWLETNGTQKSADEVKAWGDKMSSYKPYNDPEKKEWFEGECGNLGLNPAESTLFDYLEADDRQSFPKK